MRRSVLFTIACASLALACATQDQVDKPTAPDMTGVVAAYDAPTAALTEENLGEIRAALLERVDTLKELGADGEIIRALSAAGDSVDDGLEPTSMSEDELGTIQQEQRFFRDGYLRAVRICGGWGPEPTPDDASNGYILLVAGFSEDTFDSVAWGGFWNCRYRIGDTLIRVGGSDDTSYGLFQAYLGPSLPLDGAGESPIIFRFDLIATIDAEEIPLAFDFRLDPAAALVETRISVDEGYVIPAAGVDLVGVRATNGDFSCSVETRTCTNGVEAIPF